MAGRESTDQVLSGIKVVDLSNQRTGAQVGQILSDFGADVVHVEPPGGSPLRLQAAWPMWARGKRSIELDLKSGADHDVARGLARQADVVIETFRPGVADRLGLGYERLSKDNPRLVYASISGFGRTGPYRDLQGYEGVVQAKLGVPWALEGMALRPGPAFPTNAFASYPASQLALQGILAALYEREDSGRGQWVETTLAQGQTVYDTFNWFARVLAMKYNQAFMQVGRVVDGVPAGGLSFRLLIALTKDGRWLQFSQTPDRLFRAMMKLFELDWMFDDPEWNTVPEFDDINKRRAFWEMLLEKVRSRTSDEWLQAFNDHPDVWGEMFRKDAELLDHPQMLWNKMVLDRTDDKLGRLRSPGPIAHLAATPAKFDRPAPDRGAHDAAIREEAAAPLEAAPTSTAAAAAGAPLEGVTVVELGTYYAAPYAATLLADLGARVIKLEELGGDPHRNMLPFPEIAGIKCLQGKESVAVDLASPEGAGVARRIIAQSDIVLQSFRGGAAAKLGLDAETLRQGHPELIYLNAPGYGIDGPYARRPAFAPTIGAAAGWAWRNAGSIIPDGPELTMEQVKPAAMQLASAVMGGGNADGASAVTSATAMLLGLYARKRGLGGQVMTTSMLSSAANALSDIMVEYEGAPAAKVADAGLYGLSAVYRMYPAKDEWVFLAAPSDKDWTRFMETLGAENSILTDSRFATAALRAEHETALAEALGAMFLQASAREWENRLAPAGVACVEVSHNVVEANFIDEGSFGRECGFVTTAHHPFLEEVPRLAPLVRFSRSQTLAGDAGTLGQDTEKVLKEFGYSDTEIADLASKGAIILG